ncbi:MAG: hydrogenase maturation nickel metallochaperone HypA [Anaerolineae bacterium]|jgi:hydrogenase nickel incorporation protein HypA/HybF
MHEMPVTQAFLDMALEHADGRRVTDIYLQVGRMSAIVPDTVEVFFEYLSKDTLAEGARLHFEILPVAMTCQDCGRQLDLSEWSDDAPHIIMQKAFVRGCECGSKNLRVTGGVTFGLVSIDVEPGEDH